MERCKSYNMNVYLFYYRNQKSTLHASSKYHCCEILFWSHQPGCKDLQLRPIKKGIRITKV